MGRAVDITSQSGCELTADKSLLRECEDVIGRGIGTFIEVGEALAKISERKLYTVDGYDNFKDYVKEKWGISYKTAYRRIQMAKESSEPKPSMAIGVDDAVAVEVPALRQSEPVLNPEVDLSPVLPDDDEEKNDPVSIEMDQTKEYVRDFRHVIKQMQELAKELDFQPISCFLSAQQISADITNIWNSVKFASPYSKCPYCYGQPEDGCKACHDRGWMPKAVYERTPIEIRKLHELKAIPKGSISVDSGLPF